MKRSFCYQQLCVLKSASLLAIGGCCMQKMPVNTICESPRLVDYVARGDNGATLYEDYKGERMFTYSYLTNNAGAKITSVFCGYPSDSSLVHRRLYGENGKIVRTEAITGTDPMVLKLEVYDPNTEECIRKEWITQGDAQQYFWEYCRQKGISIMGIWGNGRRDCQDAGIEDFEAEFEVVRPIAKKDSKEKASKE